MAEAKQPGGLYYIADRAVDANGVAIEGAPKRPKDTPRDQQPGAIGNPASDPIQRLADTLVGALGGRGAGTANTGSNAARGPSSNSKAATLSPDEVELPTLADLPDHLAKLDTVDEVERLRAADERKGAQKLYDDRIAELTGEE